MKSRWNGIRGASVAVAGVCLSSSVASAWTSSRDADFETEFDVTPGPAAPATESAGEAALTAGFESADVAAEQTVGSYLDRLVRRAEDVDVMPECLPEKQPVAAARDADAETVTTTAAADAEDAAWQAFMAALVGPADADEASAKSETEAATESATEPAAEPSADAEPAASVSLTEPCCPAEEAARNVVAAVRPVLEFVPFRWLSATMGQSGAHAEKARVSFFP